MDFFNTLLVRFGKARLARGVKAFVPSLWRRATQKYRQLPSAVIVGAQKAGTTQLFAYLIKHPRILPGSAKEIIYFSQLSHRPVEWYRSQFPLRRHVAKVNGHVLEASPSYMSTPAATPRMRRVLPDAKIIVVLRDPVSRAFSGYQHAKTRFRERAPLPPGRRRGVAIMRMAARTGSDAAAGRAHVSPICDARLLRPAAGIYPEELSARAGAGT